MEAPIPEAWIKPVLRILRTGALHKEILITRRALQDWEAATTGWPHELIDTIRDALDRAGVTGKLVTGMEDPGETYEFWIFFGRQQLYAKACLFPDHLKIKVISAHTPLKGTDKL